MSRRASWVVVPLVLGCLGVGPSSQQARAADGINAICTPGPCATWQPRDVFLQWQVQVPNSYPFGCEYPPFREEGAFTPACQARSLTDGSILLAAATSVLIDKTAPRVTGVSTSIAPNAAGWITSPLVVGYMGSDTKPGLATSGVASCSQPPYSGPDSAAASVTGTCSDRAGNVSAPFTYTFKYDGTPPALGPIRAVPGDKMVHLRWRRPEGDVQITRSPGLGKAAESVIYRGSRSSFIDARVVNSVAYSYRLTASDQAGNVTQRVAGATAGRGILVPRPGARVSTPPMVRWSEIRNASYYNVQLYRGQVKILTVWPKATSYRLKKNWKFQGQSVRLRPGTYRLYVWPGFGAFAAQRYGRIVGTRTFVVTK